MVIIGKRVLDSRLKALYDKGIKVYSFSKANTIHDCLYCAYLTYILHNKGTPNCYSIMGTKVHDTLQALMENKATEKDLLPALQSELDDIDMLNITFPKDRHGNDSIKDKWVADMTDFCKTFKKPKGKFQTEQLVLLPLSNNRYLQGYIDLIQFHNDKEISIYDWKTSSQFTNKNVKEHGRQLVLYAMAKEYEGYKIHNVGWIMLKYITVKYNGKARINSKKEILQIKVIERSQIISVLYDVIYNKLLNAGYDKIEAEYYLQQASQAKSIEILPNNIKNQFSIKPYIRYYELTDEIKQEAMDYMNQQADLFESLDNKEENWKHRDFTKQLKSGKEINNTFFCNNLCNFKSSCKYIKAFNDLNNIADLDDSQLF